jgi:hypothetical protein
MIGFTDSFFYNLSESQSITITHNQSPAETFFLDCRGQTSFPFSFYDWPLNQSLSLMLRPTASQAECIEIKHPSEAYDQIFITVRQLRVCWCRALSLVIGRVCHLQFLLALSRAVILGSESRGTRDHILLSQTRNFPFRRILRLTGIRWRYSTPPPHGRTELLI